MWMTLTYRETAHPLAGVQVASRRHIKLPGLPDPDGVFRGALKRTHDELWRSLDGWHAFTHDNARDYAQFRDLGPHMRELYGMDHPDDTTVVTVPGLLDGEISSDMLLVPNALLAEIPAEPYEFDMPAFDARRKREQRLRREFLSAYYGTRRRPARAVGDTAVDTTDYNSVKGILLDDTRAQMWAVKNDGVAIGYAHLRGRVLDPSVIDWDMSAWYALRDILGDNIRTNPALGGELNLTLLDAVLPAGWAVAREYDEIIREAFVPVHGPDGRTGLLFWPNSD